MLEIKTNSGTLDIYNDTSIPLERNSPVFNNIGELIKTFTYTFDLPQSENNRKILGFPEQIDLEIDVQIVYAEIWFNGVPIVEGDLVLRDVSNTGDYKVSLHTQKIAWFEASLQAMHYTDGFSVIENPRKFGCHYDPNKLPLLYGFEVSGIQYIESNTTDIVNAINADTATNNCTVSESSNFYVFEQVDVNKPFWVVPLILDPEATRASGVYSVPNEGAIVTAAMARFDALTDGTPNEVCLPELWFADISGNKVNGHNGTNHTSSTPFIPQVFIKHLLEVIAEANGYTIEFDIDTDFEIIFIFNNVFSGDFRGSSSHGNHTPGQFYFWGDLVPKGKTFINILDTISKVFNLYYIIDFYLNTIYVKRCQSLLSNTIQNNIAFNYNYVKSRWEGYEGYTLQMVAGENYSDEDNYNDKLFEDYIEGNGENEIEAGFTFLLNRAQNTEGYAHYEGNLIYPPWLNYPFDNVDGRLEHDPKIDDLVLMFYLGKVDNKPKASFKGPNWSLTWESLVEKFWTDWLYFLQNTVAIKRDIYLTATQFKAFDFEKPILLDGVEYFVKRLRTTISASHNKDIPFRVEAELLKKT